MGSTNIRVMPSETLARAQAEWDALATAYADQGQELALAKATIEDLVKAMSYTAGHDRQGLDHLAAARKAERARDNAIGQTRIWVARFRELEATVARQTTELQQLRPLRDRLSMREQEAAYNAEELARHDRAAAILADANAPACALCTHGRDVHDFTPGNRQCRACPGDEERSWRHAYQPAAPATV